MNTPLNIQGYTFEGYWPLGTIFNEVPGVYVVFTQQKWLDVGQTDKLGSRMNGNNHDRQPQWVLQSDGLPIYIAFLQVSDSNRRLLVESNLRLALTPICGVR